MVWNIVLAVIAVVAGGLSYKASKDAQKAAKRAQDEMSGVLVNKDSNIEPIPVIYGERRIGGTRVYVHTEGGDENLWLYMAIVLCEGEVDDIHSIEIDDYAIDEGRYGTIEELSSTNPDRRIFRSVEQAGENYVYFECYRGKDNQPASDILSGASNWGSNHKLSGVAYLAVRLQWDQDVFSGIPNITAVVKGKKVYDPRKDSTSSAYDSSLGVSTHRLNQVSTWQWSSNPALCLRDYLTNERYGKGLNDAVIDIDSFAGAADDLDNFTVTPYSGGPTGVKLFQCNAIVDTGKEIFENVGDMLLGCKGFLPYINGQYALYIDQSVSTSVVTLDTSTIIGGIAIKSERKEDKFNRVVCKFPNPETKWEPDQAIWPDSGSTEETTFLSEDGDEILVEEIDLNTVTSYYAARDFARIFCLRSRNALRVALTATSEALNLRIGDRVSITHPTPGWTAKPFQVEEVGLRYDGTVDLQLVEYDSTIYAYDPASEEQTYSDTDLPDPFTVAAPSIPTLTAGVTVAADGSAIPYINISFTGSADYFVSKYIISVVPDSFNPYQVEISTKDLTTNQLDGTDPITYLLQPVFVDGYTIKLRAENAAGARSESRQAGVNVQGDTTRPGAPSWPSANDDECLFPAIKSIGLLWTNPIDSDFAYTQIQRKVTGSADTTYQVVANVFGRPGEKGTYTDTGLAEGGDYTYRLYSSDWSQNSSLSSSGARNIAALGSLNDEVDLRPQEAHGYVYYSNPQASAPNSPTATAYAFDADPDDNPIIGLDPEYDPATPSTAGWSINPFTPDTDTASSSNPYWVCRYHAYQDAVGGTSTSVDFSTPFTSTVFEGLVTFQNLNNELGTPSTGLVTTIDGGLINTGEIVLTGDNVAGMAVRLGKSDFTDDTAGFWLGNTGDSSSVQPEFNIGNATNFLKFDSSGIETKAITIKDTSGNLVFDADEVDFTYIKNVSIDTAEIADGAITTAKIGNLEVKTVKIDDNAVTLPEGSDGTDGSNTAVSPSWTEVDNGGSSARVTLSWPDADNRPSAVICSGFVSFLGSSADAGTLQVRMRAEGGAGNQFTIANTVGQSFDSGQGGAVVTTGHFALSNQTSPMEVWIECNASSSGAVRQIGGFGFFVLGAKK